jgi:hypothetical protein
LDSFVEKERITIGIVDVVREEREKRLLLLLLRGTRCDAVI